MSPSPTITTQSQQRGVVLVVSLLILLVLTLLGISSLDGSIMEEKMAANTQTANVTFQEAESAIRQTFYAEKLHNKDDRSAAVKKALNDTASARHRDHSTGSITSSTDLVHRGTAPTSNSSSGLVTHTIELIGAASIDNITNTHTQGYVVYPLPAMP